MQINKIKTYINFAIKSNKIIYGQDLIKNYKRKAFLMIVATDVGQKFMANSIEYAKKLDCRLYETEQTTINQLINADNCKIFLIKSNSLAEAIINENKNINILREVNLIESNK